MKRSIATLGAILTTIALTAVGCGKSERLYQVSRFWTDMPYTNRSAFLINSPARDMGYAGMHPHYNMIISEFQMRKLGLNPDQHIKWTRKQHEEDAKLLRGGK